MTDTDTDTGIDTDTPEALRGMDLLRFATAGSVDDGKSTLIGRLLLDSKAIFEDQLEHVEETSRRRGDGYVNLALLTDGLRAEREQGITIDVAYRYFATPARTNAEIVIEVAASTLTERGATRADDRISEAAMEDRKKEGYF